ncbi:ribokinase [Singulisphaera acidiphila]|uniref:Ribokinase n=1 Tax=Singulisphaera acidiphila (strain ATCC BAA-1392 / DSM 18658 / VKM B-2454 / MOB10) TaxID=886293 RepID=L0DCE5_SINAD|nr:ribokinase [Singulisphaera acidiphila]AGA26887.1 sugar kinase, ribokinase [Singulisphaera acidiphila DSM 18658]
MARVVVLGSSNTDMTVHLPRLPTSGETLLGGSFFSGPGGKGANQAVAARRAGASVVFLSAVGDDPLGHQALDRYRRETIDVSEVLVVPHVSSGVALIFVNDAGENMIGVAPGANVHLDVAAVDRLPDSVFEPGSVLLAGLEVPLETVASAVRRAQRAGLRVLLNPAPADLRLLDSEILRFVDILTPNHIEVQTLAGQPIGENPESLRSAAEAMLARGVGAVVVTNGKAGCLVLSRDAGETTCRAIRAFPVEAVDTVGAGDAFNGALATAIAEGRPLFESAVWASAAAALAVTQPGAQTALAPRAAIDQLAATYDNKFQ